MEEDTVDTQGLVREARHPGAVAWSGDNLLAVASGSSAVIFSPANLAGPRAHLRIEEAQDKAEEDEECGNPPRQLLEAPAADAWGQIIRLHDKAKTSGPAQVRALAWAPSGTAPAGGCLLTALYDDGKVCGLPAAKLLLLLHVTRAAVRLACMLPRLTLCWSMS